MLQQLQNIVKFGAKLSNRSGDVSSPQNNKKACILALIMLECSLVEYKDDEEDMLVYENTDKRARDGESLVVK